MNYMFIICLCLTYLATMDAGQVETSPPSAAINVDLKPEMSQLGEPSNSFGFSFLNQLNQDDQANKKNVLVSPFSILLAYGMLLEGADGLTKQQIMDTLQLSSVTNDSEIIHKASQKILTEYKKVELGQVQRNFSLLLGNLAMLNNKAQLKEKFRTNLLENYMANATNEDFETQGEAIMKKLNSWVASQTNNKIPQLFTEPPTPETILLLVNTVYFKGKWEEPFKPTDTIDDTFENADGTQSNVKMMFLRGKKYNYAHLQDKKLKIVELPYNGNISMIVMMPTEVNGLNQLVSSLNHTEFTNLLGSLKKQKLTTLGFPKFKLEDSHELHSILPKLGLTLPFTDQAELNKIAEGAELKVSKSMQKCLLEVDEEGSEAAAATFVITVLRMSYVSFDDFIADKPFLFVIRDNLTGVNLFMGQVKKMANIDRLKASTEASAPSSVGETLPTNESTTA